MIRCPFVGKRQWSSIDQYCNFCLFRQHSLPYGTAANNDGKMAETKTALPIFYSFLPLRLSGTLYLLTFDCTTVKTFSSRNLKLICSYSYPGQH